MRHPLALVALLAVAASQRGGCSPSRYDACDGKRCADPCTVCAPGDAKCVETAVVKGCDPAGECVAAGTFTCPSPPPPSACTGRTCGAECTIAPPCAYATPPCMVPIFLGHCDLAGQCVAEPVSCPPLDACAGKACGDDCSLCGSVPCMSPVRTTCDVVGRCVPFAEAVCDPCAGKACGASCNPCGDANPCPTFAATACDGSGACVTVGTGVACR